MTTLSYSQFLEKMIELNKKGWVKTHRSGATGIGKTIEDWLGIRENNVQGPDFETYELKAARKDGGSMVTLLTKTPQPKGSIKQLLSIYGYPPEDKEDTSNDVTKPLETRESLFPTEGVIESKHIPKTDKKILHNTVYSTRMNSRGFQIKRVDNTWKLMNKNDILCYYSDDYLSRALHKKYPDKLIVVETEHKGSKEKEEFWFTGPIKIYEKFHFATFNDLVANDTILLDLRIGQYPNGRPHDHGTGFRSLPRNIDKCFEKVRVLET